MTDRARPLPCRVVGCPGVLGRVEGGALVVAAGVAVSCGPMRCVLACPACGAAREWRGRELRVPPRRAA